MSAFTKEIFIVGAKRTAFGKFGGKLTKVTATQLATESTKAALTAAKVPPEVVDSVYVGNVLHTSGGNSIYIARHVALGAGMPVTTPAVAVNRLCGSGFESIIQACREISMGDAQVAIAAGVESMSQAPFEVHNMRFGTKLGTPMHLQDVLWESLTDKWTNMPMAITAENLAAKYNIGREECDQFALESHQKWAKAHAAGHFNAEIVPITVKGKKKDEVIDVDEHPRPDCTMASLASLPPVFKKDGKVTAGTASGINDGAGALVLASAQAVKDLGLVPLARVVSYHSVGVQPEIMGIGPVTAIQGALLKAGLRKEAMDTVEINEAFAPQVLACNRVLGFDPAKLNVCGGAIAMGHPLGASGSRIITHLTHDTRRTKTRYSVGSACVGGGMGTAVIIERC